MSEKDTNCDETDVETDGMGDRNSPNFELPDCCRSMVERMMKAFGNPPEKQIGAQEGTQGSGPPDCCKSMMTQMMKAYSEPQGEGESAAENPRACCGEPR